MRTAAEIEAHHPWEEHLDAFGRSRQKRGLIKYPAAAGQLLGAVAIGQHPKMADAHEAFGKHMEQETADKLLGVQGHDLGLIVTGIILPAERHLPILESPPAARC